ncbi:MAG: DEAD/DEAH box helicase family protein [Planctomycetes bacterium]|nr:DEAD/DEAH box helicase family protein [Planctomycetota bacterium]
MLVLRTYQEEAKGAVYEHLRTRADNPCVVIPTAGGKTPVMASICKDAVTTWNGRVLILAHVKELLEQATDKLARVCPEVRFGVYSAGLRRRDTDASVIVAGIQSVYKRACELDTFDLVVVDEAHMIPPEGDGMYRQFLAEANVVNPDVRVVGFTATPFRLKTGAICTPDGFLNHICYEVGVRELIRDGYLCPLVTKAGKARADTNSVHVRGGEFVPSELEDVMDDDELVQRACAELTESTSDRSAVLIFASGVKHGRHVVSVLKQHGVQCGFVCNETPDAERDETLRQFRAGALKYLCNINVLTTGFDAPHIDCVAMLRPTMSPGLYYQMVGRGFRLFPGKHNCLVLDFGGNVLRHGPVDEIKLRHRRPKGTGIAPAKECPECQAVIAAGYGRCPQCGFQFPPPERRKHDAKASDAGVLSGAVTDTDHDVQEVVYSVHRKRGAPQHAPASLRVEYRLALDVWQSEFVCFEHEGYARHKAASWWKRRSCEAVPETAAEALRVAQAGGVADTKRILVRTVAGEKYGRVIGYELGDVPEPLFLEVLEPEVEEEVVLF